MVTVGRLELVPSQTYRLYKPEVTVRRVDGRRQLWVVAEVQRGQRRINVCTNGTVGVEEHARLEHPPRFEDVARDVLQEIHRPHRRDGVRRVRQHAHAHRELDPRAAEVRVG